MNLQSYKWELGSVGIAVLLVLVLLTTCTDKVKKFKDACEELCKATPTQVVSYCNEDKKVVICE